MNSSGEYTVEYVFKANIDNLKEGAKEAKSLVENTASIGKDFKVNWGEGSGSIEDYSKWLSEAKKNTEDLSVSTNTWSLSQEQLANIEKRNNEYLAKYNAQVESLTKNTAQATEDFSGYNNAIYTTANSVNELDTKTKALLVSITALETVFVKDSLSAFASYEDAMYGMATTVGNVGGTIEQAMEGIRQTTSSGMLSETDASKAINNLTSFGYSVAEATELIQALTYSSEAHRRTNMTVAEQVVQTTEGIRRQSSMMARASGNAETLSDAEERYAQAIGKTASELTEAENRQAIFNSYIEAGNSSLAVAEGYEDSYSASVQRMNNALTDLKVAFGQAFAPIAKTISNIVAWIVANKQLVLGIGTFVGVLLGSGGVFFALSKIIPAIKSAVAWFTALTSAGKGLVGVLALVATGIAVVATVSAIESMNTGLEGIAESAGDASAGIGDFTDSVGGAGGAVRDLSKDLEKLERQYKDELKTIEQSHRKTIDKLTKQIEDANVDYRRAIEERNAEFAVQQAEEEKKHQEKVDELMTQINFLQRYNNKYNQEKLQKLQYALARENALYKKQTEAEKAELDLQNENDRQAYETRRSELQAELDAELAFMDKHRADLQEVQDWILEDEIEALKRRHEEQRASYEEQAVSAGIGGSNIGSMLGKGLQEGLNEYLTNNAELFKNDGKILGFDFSEGIINGLVQGLNTLGEKIKNTKLYTDSEGNSITIGNISTVFNEIGKYADWLIPTNALRRFSKGITTGDWGFATGGYTGQGGANEIAGVVHKGEYVLPQEMVDQTTGTPKSLGNTYNIYVEGVFATSQAERRRVADQIVQAINQNNKSRLEASWQ